MPSARRASCAINWSDGADPEFEQPSALDARRRVNEYMCGGVRFSLVNAANVTDVARTAQPVATCVLLSEAKDLPLRRTTRRLNYPPNTIGEPFRDLLKLDSRGSAALRRSAVWQYCHTPP